MWPVAKDSFQCDFLGDKLLRLEEPVYLFWRNGEQFWVNPARGLGDLRSGMLKPPLSPLRITVG